MEGRRMVSEPASSLPSSTWSPKSQVLSLSAMSCALLKTLPASLHYLMLNLSNANKFFVCLLACFASKTRQLLDILATSLTAMR